MAWNTNLIQKTGPMVNDEGIRVIYEYEFLCLTLLVAESRPYVGDVNPDDEDAVCRRVFTQSVSPTHSRIEATFQKGGVITLTHNDLDDGDEWDEGGAIEDAEETTEGDTVRVTRPAKIDNWVRDDQYVSNSDKQYLRSQINKTNPNTYEGESAGKYKLSNVTWENIGSLNEPKWLFAATYELNTTGWNSNQYPQGTSAFPIRV